MKLLLFNLATDIDDRVLGFTTHWIRALAEQVERIHVITMRAGRIALPDNVHVHSVGKEKGYSEPRRAVEFYRHLVRVLREDPIDVCFSHMIPVFTVLAAPVLRLNGVPIVTWYAHPSSTWTLKLAHHLSSRVVASLETAYPYRHDKLEVVGQGINTELFTVNGTSPEDPPLILCVGRLSRIKDHPTLLRAAAVLRERWGKPFRVVIVGDAVGRADAPYVDSLHELVRGLGLQNQVRFQGAVPIPELPGWYRRCTVHVNMTPTGAGDKVALEAMSCARLCLAANKGFGETFGKYAPLLLFRHGDAEDLARKLIAVLELSESERHRMGCYLRERVVQMHSLNGLTDRLMDVFREISVPAR